MPKPLIVIPVAAPVQQAAFDFNATLEQSLIVAGESLQAGDVLAVSSKYAAISEGQIVKLDEVVVSAEAAAIAERYSMNPMIAALVMQQADHIFGGITGFLLTFKDGILSPNAGIDRSNIPNGYAVVFPEHPYQTAARIRHDVRARLGVDVGVILTDSWLMPGRLGTTGVALASAGFKPVQDERGKLDPLLVTRRGIVDTICAAAQLVMGERDEATPFAIVRNTGVELSDAEITEADVALEWNQCIYMQSEGLLVEVK